MITIKCDRPRMFKINLILKPKSTTAGIETGTQDSDYMSDA